MWTHASARMGSINVFTGIQSDASKCKFVSDDCCSPLKLIVCSRMIYAAYLRRCKQCELHNASLCGNRRLFLLCSLLLNPVVTCLWHIRECVARPIHFLWCLSRVRVEVRKALLFSYLFFFPKSCRPLDSCVRKREKSVKKRPLCACFCFDECSCCCCSCQH